MAKVNVLCKSAPLLANNVTNGSSARNEDAKGTLEIHIDAIWDAR